MKIAVAGGGGFIAGHLVRHLAEQGHQVVTMDRKSADDWEQIHRDLDVRSYFFRDLSDLDHCRRLVEGCDQVYMLAADMGGMGFIEHNKLDCMLSVLPSTNMLIASAEAGVDRYFYSSSACVYAADKQTDTDVTALKEADAYPAMAEDGYGWEKLFTERMCRHFFEDRGLETRVARYHNVYGPKGSWRGGREKAPAAICRKVAEAVISGRHQIDIWGDGEQTRSFMFVTDCVEGSDMLQNSYVREPVNLGSAELVSINQLVSLVEGIAGVTLERTYDLSAPQGVRGRNSDNTIFRGHFGWEPSIPLLDGLETTYAWIYDRLMSEA